MTAFTKVFFRAFRPTSSWGSEFQIVVRKRLLHAHTCPPTGSAGDCKPFTKRRRGCRALSATAAAALCHQGLRDRKRLLSAAVPAGVHGLAFLQSRLRLQQPLHRGRTLHPSPPRPAPPLEKPPIPPLAFSQPRATHRRKNAPGAEETKMKCENNENSSSGRI